MHEEFQAFRSIFMICYVWHNITKLSYKIELANPVGSFYVFGITKLH